MVPLRLQSRDGRLFHKAGVPMHAAWIRLRSHIVTGFIFIMPVLITLAVLMKFWNHLLKVGSRLAKLLHHLRPLRRRGDGGPFLSVHLYRRRLPHPLFVPEDDERADRSPAQCSDPRLRPAPIRGQEKDWRRGG